MTKKRTISILLAIFIVCVCVAAATTIFGLTPVVNLADGDLFAVVDVSDDAQSTDGSTRKVTVGNVVNYVQLDWSNETAQFTGVGIGEAGVAAQINSNAALTIDLDDADLTIDCGTDKTLLLTTPVWDDLRVSPISVKVTGNNQPDWELWKNNGGVSAGVYTYMFDPLADEEVWFEAQLPHGYAEGEDIEVHVHWFPDSLADGTPANQEVEWGLEYVWVDISEDPAANTTLIYGSTHTPADANVAADRHYLTEIGVLTGTGYKISSILMCRLFRNADGANDDYEDDVGLLSVDFHVPINTLGSRTEDAK